nr:hypothetical protein [Tanacetum cinerariifolium]
MRTIVIWLFLGLDFLFVCCCFILVAMSVHNSMHNTPHNSVHNTPHNSDDEEPNNVVTLISKLDLSHPLYLHPNDSTTLTIVSIKLKGTENYNVWSCDMLLTFEGRNKSEFIDNICRRSYTDEVLETFDRVDGSVTFNLHHKINSLTQNGSSVTEYFNKLSTLWKQFDALIKLSSKESHRATVVGSGTRPNNASISNNNWNRRSTGGGGPTLVCENCGYNGHTVDRCFKLIGYPTDSGKNNGSNTNQNTQNFNRIFINNINFVGYSSSSGLSDEHIFKLFTLIKDNSLNDKEKGVQANMAGFLIDVLSCKVDYLIIKI